MSDNVKLTGQDVLNALTMAVEAVTKTGQSQEISGDYINPTAAILLHKFADVQLESLRYQSGELIEKTYLSDITATLANFNRSDYVTGTRAQILLDAVYNNNAFFKNFTIKYGDELTIPIDVKAYAKRQLMSTERLGRQLAAGEASALASISGYEMFLNPVELQYDIKMSEIRNNLYNPNFEKEVLVQPMLNVLAEDLLDLATNGISDAYSSIANGFLYLGIGHEKLLTTLNGRWTNTNGKAIVVGKFGNYHTPHRLDLTKAGITASSYTGFNIITAMDYMYKMLPAQFRGRPDLKWVLAQADADLYADAKSEQIKSSLGINTEARDKLANEGGTPNHRGIAVVINPKKVPISDGGNFYLGCLKELYVGTQRMVNTTREYKARMSSGGDGIENTKHLNIDFQVGLRNAFVICAPSMTVETPVMIKSIVSGATVYTDREYNKGEEYVSSSSDQSVVTGVTVYCDTPDALIYGSIAGSFDNGTLLPANALPTISGSLLKYANGSLITLTTGQYLTLRAYRVLGGGTLVETPSALATIRYTS